jgi:NADH:ubiquinone oxidoreductase subunit B-like Fe-S oxidoreductase
MKGLLDQQFEENNIVLSQVEDLLNWARLSSLWHGFWLSLLCNRNDADHGFGL